MLHAMTEEQLSLLLNAAEAKADEKQKGFVRMGQGRTLTLYVSSSASTLTVGKVETLRSDRGLVQARTSKGEQYVLALADVFAGSVDAPASDGRKAGFV